MGLRPIYYDTETTGLDSKNDRIIEIAAFDPVLNKTFSELVNPQIPISEASQILCGITEDMVKDKDTFESVGKRFTEFCTGDMVLIAHNNDTFDKLFLDNEFKRANLEFPKWQFIDSLKWARKYRPDLPKHSLQYLRQIYKIEENKAHRALNDVIVLQAVFEKMIDDLPIEDVIKLLNFKRTDNTDFMPFGKYQGKKLSDVPKSYVSWLKKSLVFEKPENKSLKENFEKLGLLQEG
jgi:DNA polymerase-3 subunit epsilon